MYQNLSNVHISTCITRVFINKGHFSISVKNCSLSCIIPLEKLKHYITWNIQGDDQAQVRKTPLNIGQGKFPCKHCSKSFNGRSGLNFHMAKHTGRFRFWCELCQRVSP